MCRTACERCERVPPVVYSKGGRCVVRGAGFSNNESGLPVVSKGAVNGCSGGKRDGSRRVGIGTVGAACALLCPSRRKRLGYRVGVWRQQPAIVRLTIGEAEAAAVGSGEREAL